MKASGQNMADIFAYMVVSVGLLSLSRIDLLLSEPFGSLMVFTRTIFLLGLMAGLHQLMRLQNNRLRQPVRVRA